MAIDILMSIGDPPIAAECQTEVDPSLDPMLSGFEIGKFFEVTDFDLDVGIEDQDSRNGLEGLGKDKSLHPDTVKALQGLGKSGSKKFEKWLSETMPEGQKYPVDMQAFSFSRQFDKASPRLFNACCNTETLKSAALVKRKPIGITQAVHKPHVIADMGYLRVDFADVLIISINWEIEETVKEKVKFICRGARVRYRPQTDKGNLAAEVAPGKWDPGNKLKGFVRAT